MYRAHKAFLQHGSAAEALYAALCQHITQHFAACSLGIRHCEASLLHLSGATGVEEEEHVSTQIDDGGQDGHSESPSQRLAVLIRDLQNLEREKLRHVASFLFFSSPPSFHDFCFDVDEPSFLLSSFVDE